MKRIAFYVYSIAIPLIVMTFPISSHANTIEILTFRYPPILTTADSGIVPQIMSEAANEAGINIKLVVIPRKRAIKMFKDGKFNMFLGEGRYFPSLKASIDVQKLMYARIVIVYLKSQYNSFDYHNAEFKGKVFGVSLGSNLTPVFEKKGWTVETVRALEYNIKKLTNKRIDFWGTVDVSAIDMIKKHYPGRENDYAMSEIEKFSIELLSKKGSPLEPSFLKLQAGFKQIVKNGKYKKILEKFYGKGKVPVSVMAQ